MRRYFVEDGADLRDNVLRGPEGGLGAGGIVLVFDAQPLAIDVVVGGLFDDGEGEAVGTACWGGTGTVGGSTYPAE